MEGNSYFLPLRNSKRYTPYEFDKMMSHNENRMGTLGKLIDQDIYNCMMANRKTQDRNTPLVLTPKLILDKSNGINTLGSKMNSNNFNSQSHNSFSTPLKEVPNESFKISQNPRYMNSIQRQNNNYEQFNPEEEIKAHKWRYEGTLGNNNRPYRNPRVLHTDDEPLKVSQDYYNNDFPGQQYNNRNNNIFRSQDFSRSRRNYNEERNPTPYDEGRNSYGNDRFGGNNNANFDGGNNQDFRERSLRANDPEYNIGRNEEYNNDNKNLNFVRRGNYNSQLNYPNRYED